jgi:hypothetical protein
MREKHSVYLHVYLHNHKFFFILRKDPSSLCQDLKQETVIPINI